MKYIAVIQQNNKIRVERLEAKNRDDAYDLINDSENVDEMDYYTALILTYKEAGGLVASLLGSK